MVNELNQTPKAMRLHIGVFGSTNAGKSTLINSLSGHNVSITSPVAGTTTDPVFKPMELMPLGPVVLIDTAGLDDYSELGSERIKKSIKQLSSCDSAILVVSSRCKDFAVEKEHEKILKKANIPYIVVVNAFDENVDKKKFDKFEVKPLFINIKDDDIISLKEELIKKMSNKSDEVILTKDIVKKGDLVFMVIPQDYQAPKGRLILPQVQVLRDLIDNGCRAMMINLEDLDDCFNKMKLKPDLVITDSQIFDEVNKNIPKDIPLTSFSLLMAKIKGDLKLLIENVTALDNLVDGDKVGILESCSHHPLEDDIAREQIPRLVRKYTGKNVEIKTFAGCVDAEDFEGYSLVIHCGGCMVNRTTMVKRQRGFELSNIPLTNFGVAIAYMNKMLDRIIY